MPDTHRTRNIGETPPPTSSSLCIACEHVCCLALRGKEPPHRMQCSSNMFRLLCSTGRMCVFMVHVKWRVPRDAGSMHFDALRNEAFTCMFASNATAFCDSGINPPCCAWQKSTVAIERIEKLFGNLRICIIYDASTNAVPISAHIICMPFMLHYCTVVPLT